MIDELKYPENHMYFLAKDPHWTFVRWSVSAEILEQRRLQAFGRREGGDLVIRVHEVTGLRWNLGKCIKDSLGFFDVPITVNTDHWYLHIEKSGRCYCIELGLKLDGVFAPLLTSNCLTLPLDDVGREAWSEIRIGNRLGC